MFQTSRLKGKACQIDPTIRGQQDTHLKYEYTVWLKRWKKINSTNTDQKKAGFPLLISHRVDFRGNNIIRDRKVIS